MFVVFPDYTHLLFVEYPKNEINLFNTDRVYNEADKI